MNDGVAQRTAELIERYYTVEDADAPRIEEELIRVTSPLIRHWARHFETLTQDDAEERYTEVCARLLVILRSGRPEPQRRVRSFLALAKTVAQRLAIDNI